MNPVLNSILLFLHIIFYLTLVIIVEYSSLIPST